MGMGTILKLVAGIRVGIGIRILGMVGMGINICPRAALQLEHCSLCCCSNPNEGTLLLCISVYAVSVDLLTHAVDLHKTASHLWALSP